MLVIPAINCQNFKCVKERLEIAAEFLPSASRRRWVQIDISDGKFTKVKSWNNPKQFQNYLRLTTYDLRLNIEVHLMVNNLRPNVKKWLKIADRIIFHFEDLDENEFKFLKEIGRKNKSIKFGIAITPKTPVEIIVPFLNYFRFVQLLAVNPGYSGQKFGKKTIDRIKFLKKYHPKIVVEIDGGIDAKTAKMVKKAGADIVNSGSYIFDSKNPKE
ncbi:hypothetical protein HZB05_00615, partial [Candidatus Wolfebacteria bacterium]|nr:hypothetical protein [Candidatus Wolfebacteria bacterium]